MTNSLFSYLLADNQLICRLRWFPKLAVGSNLLANEKTDTEYNV